MNQGPNNRMKEIADMYGKKFYEPFWAANKSDNTKEVFRFTENGMEHFLASAGYEKAFGYVGGWSKADFYLQHLIVGDIWIIENEKYEQGKLFGS